MWLLVKDCRLCQPIAQCLSLFRLLLKKNIMNWLAYRQTYFSVLEAGKPTIKVLVDSVSDKDLLPC